MQGTLPEDWSEPQKWRYRCPVGHAHILPSDSRESAYCPTCNESYCVEQLRDLTTETRDPPTV
jgi:hypothetical protein